mmetsp:Transcript_22462/g.71833  ORF Transcript_22462/g.71833 Transcript_22462/m.71833 type:complete len:135 (+) Transcript_22462:251-655(+)
MAIVVCKEEEEALEEHLEACRLAWLSHAEATGKHAEALEYAVTAAERSRIQAAMVAGAVAPPPQAQGEAAADYSGGAAEYSGEVSDDDDPFGDPFGNSSGDEYLAHDPSRPLPAVDGRYRPKVVGSQPDSRFAV